jgi:hypothetical protein
MVRPQFLPQADVIEMDCEGAELEIIENLSIRPRVITVETHSNHDDVLNALEKIGYVPDEVITDGKNQSNECTQISAIRETD